MSFVVRLGVVLAVFWFDAAVAQEGYLGHDHDKWHHGFYQTLERPDIKSPCCNLTDCRPTSGRQERKEKEVRATVEACQGQEAKSMGQTLVRTSRPSATMPLPRMASRMTAKASCPTGSLGVT